MRIAKSPALRLQHALCSGIQMTEAHGKFDGLIDALRQDVFDFLIKPVSRKLLVAVAQNASAVAVNPRVLRMTASQMPDVGATTSHHA